MDELPPTDLAAWEAEELSPGFDDRVMARLGLGPTEALRPEVTPPRRGRVVAIASAALAIAAALVLAWGLVDRSPPRHGEVVAVDDPKVVAPWSGVEAVVSPGASMSWEVTGDQVRLEQARGRVRYQVVPGTAVAVHTPAGTVDVTGTTFEVEVIAVSEINRSHLRLPLAAAAAATVLAVVVVHEGTVDAHNDGGTVQVRAGSRAVMSDASAPAIDAPEALAQAEEPAEPAPEERSRISPEQRRRHAATRQRIEQAIARRVAAAPEPEPAEAPPPQDDEPSDLPDGLRAAFDGDLDEEYVREAIRRDLIPLAKDCYISVLEVDPEFGGTLVLEFDVLGDEEVGGVVDAVVPGEGTNVTHAEFVECMSESMMTVTMPPPQGGGTVHVTYPFLFEPG